MKSKTETLKSIKLLLITLVLIMVGNVMAESEKSESNNQKGNRIVCLTNPDMWNSMSYTCRENETIVPLNNFKLDVIAGGQGAIAVKSWNKNEIKIRVVSEVWGDSLESANKYLEYLSYKFEAGKLLGTFSAKESYQSPWAVSFEITIPNGCEITLNTVNGAIYVDDLNGTISAKAVNGAVYFKEVSGKVAGKSTNGRVEATTQKKEWVGESLDISTENGDAVLFLPENFSANLSTQSERGAIFIKSLKYSLNIFNKKLNEGGKTISAKSENGNILLQF